MFVFTQRWFHAVLLSRCFETNDRVWSFNCQLHKLSHESRRNITSFLFQLCRCSSLVPLYFEGIHLKICLDAPSSSMKHLMSFWWSPLLSAGALRSKSFYILILTTSENGYWNIKLFSHWLGAKLYQIIESFIVLLVSWDEWPIGTLPNHHLNLWRPSQNESRHVLPVSLHVSL